MAVNSSKSAVEILTAIKAAILAQYTTIKAQFEAEDPTNWVSGDLKATITTDDVQWGPVKAWMGDLKIGIDVTGPPYSPPYLSGGGLAWWPVRITVQIKEAKSAEVVSRIVLHYLHLIWACLDQSFPNTAGIITDVQMVSPYSEPTDTEPNVGGTLEIVAICDHRL